MSSLQNKILNNCIASGVRVYQSVCWQHMVHCELLFYLLISMCWHVLFFHSIHVHTTVDKENLNFEVIHMFIRTFNGNHVTKSQWYVCSNEICFDLLISVKGYFRFVPITLRNLCHLYYSLLIFSTDGVHLPLKRRHSSLKHRKRL